MTDARFEDAGSRPLRLRACELKDLQVIATIVQDAIFTRGDMSWDPERREFAFLLSRFRWETFTENSAANQKPERVGSVLKIADILELSATDLIEQSAPDVFSCLDISFEPSEDMAGRLCLVLSGDREAIFDVECIEVTLTDVTDPYPAASKKKPEHG